MYKQYKAIAVFLLPCIVFTATVDGGKIQTYKREASNFIVGGMDADPGQFPHQVLLLDRNENPFCGGTLICKDWVLTAAHCISRRSPAFISYGTNDYDFGNINDANIIKVERKYRHERYNRRSLRNDIALLKLGSSIECTSTAGTIPLEQKLICGLTDSNIPAVLVSGHGTLSEGGGGMTETLQYVLLEMNTDQECKQSYGSGNDGILPGMMCASETDKDSCQGDSGGPLMTTSDGETGDTVCGIVSWGIGCARPGYPGVYTDVGFFYDWIQAKLERHGGCETCSSDNAETTVTDNPETEGTTDACSCTCP